MPKLCADDVAASADDVLVYKDETNPEWMWGTQITEVDGRYLLLSIRRDTSRVCLQFYSWLWTLTAHSRYRKTFFGLLIFMKAQSVRT